ncbi:hypothetical protein [Flavobacterium ginsenosidimutans]|uniref:hypothetical protein n=1 Tax=Flavobacterium ginsenosidimutans TaxID=687844 RepID=UPI0013A685E5|nr:hypothetical protein [Flavobacterium ginsenosidimutans]KAF2331737.1 hypothetical protein DM444_11080 [Flavobacterium ginsenosidimutans]
MSYQGTRILMLSLLLLLFSCKDKVRTKEEQADIDRLRMKKSEKEREIYFNYSKALMGEKEYFKVYNMAKDSVQNWAENKLRYSTTYKKFMFLDTLICFNKEKNKCLLALGYHNYGIHSSGVHKGEEVTHDIMNQFFGAKFKGKWFFYYGASIYLPRDYYQDDIHKPLNWALMKQIAIEEVFRGYLIEVSSDNSSERRKKYKINNKLFIYMEANNGDGTFGGGGNTFEEMVLRLVNENWRGERDTIK